VLERKVSHGVPDIKLVDELQHPPSEKISGDVDGSHCHDHQDQRANSIYQKLEHEGFLDYPLTGWIKC
jgi:hypothetical protein